MSDSNTEMETDTIISDLLLNLESVDGERMMWKYRYEKLKESISNPDTSNESEASRWIFARMKDALDSADKNK